MCPVTDLNIHNDGLMSQLWLKVLGPSAQKVLPVFFLLNIKFDQIKVNESTLKLQFLPRTSGPPPWFSFHPDMLAPEGVLGYQDISRCREMHKGLLKKVVFRTVPLRYPTGSTGWFSVHP